MTAQELSNCLALAIDAVKGANGEILQVYEADNFEVEAKGDQSPLTRADRNAHHVITKLLERSGLPILSEEGKEIPYEQRKDWPYFWMVDPLDGTKEFIKRNGEFTVNIALIHQQRPVLGVVSIPVSGDIFYATEEGGANLIRGGVRRKLPKRIPPDLNTPGIRVVASRSHMDERSEQFIKQLNEPVLLSKGSSIKFLLLAEGLADVYPRFAPTMEWDTAAAHIIVQETGLSVFLEGSCESLQYNKENLLNPFFIVR